MGLPVNLIPCNGIRSTLARIIICTVTVVVVTAALFAVPIRDRASSAALTFLFVVLIVSAIWGFRYAVFVSLLSALGFSWLLPPVGVFWLDDPRDVLTMVAFLVIGIIPSRSLVGGGTISPPSSMTTRALSSPGSCARRCVPTMSPTHSSWR
jgi:hypothetical protein